MSKNNIKKTLKAVIEESRPEKEIIKEIKKRLPNFIEKLKKAIGYEGIDAEVFIGGSYAKGTLVRKNRYDIDILVRFNWKYETLSNDLKPILKRLCKEEKLNLETLHGSRDYFRIYGENKRIAFEIIPVTKIKNPKEERNITDLSYFHVPYVKRKAKKIKDEILLAKTFCHAQKVYGAESYIHGFSGYALECLIIYYGNFEKMLEELSKVKERTVIDPEKKFKRKKDVFFELNENKLHSPIILIDPTYKERNALAALSYETFVRFQESAKKFLKNPKRDFFIEKDIDSDKIKNNAKKRKAEFLHIKLKTDRQPGDIAGTKLKKFYNFLDREISKYFKVYESEFDYNDSQSADCYFVSKSKKQIVRIGPPLKMKGHVKAFKREHKKTYEKSGYVHAKIDINFSLKEFIKEFSRENKKTLSEMSIEEIKITS